MNIERIETMISRLRTDHLIRKTFDMSDWMGEDHPSGNVCGTVGCIAGKAIMMFAPETLHFMHDFSLSGGRLLGLDNTTSQHLFMPSYWVNDVVEETYFLQLSHNERPNLDTVAKMKEFALKYSYGGQHAITEEPLDIFERIGPDQAANGLSGLLSHPGYVDWREAIEA